MYLWGCRLQSSLSFLGRVRSCCMDSKQSLSQGTAGFCSRCREAGEAVILCLPGVAQPSRYSSHQQRKETLITPGENPAIFHPKVLCCRGISALFCSVLLCPWKWLVILGKKVQGTLLAKEEPTSCWATVRICEVVTSFCVGPWHCGRFLGLVGRGCDG